MNNANKKCTARRCANRMRDELRRGRRVDLSREPNDVELYGYAMGLSGEEAESWRGKSSVTLDEVAKEGSGVKVACSSSKDLDEMVSGRLGSIRSHVWWRVRRFR